MSKQKNSFFTPFIFGMAALFTAAFFLCMSMVNTVNRRMNESATTNLLSASWVIHDTLEGYINSDLDCLGMVGDLFKSSLQLDSAQIDAFCDSMGFDWVAVVDNNGRGADYFADRFFVDEQPFAELWAAGQRGMSKAYIGDTGRQQLAMWSPIYNDGQYVGTVFGGVMLTKYYSSNVFTFYDGNGRTYMFDGRDGSWVLKSFGTDGAASNHTDIYSLLEESGNKSQTIDQFRKAVEQGKPGTAAFNFNGELSYLCFLPMEGTPDWYITTVIARDYLLRESVEIRRLIQLVLVVFFVSLASAATAFAVWRERKTRSEEQDYRETLFSNISANLDSAFLIYEKDTGNIAFVSDNISRLFGIERQWIGQDINRLFDWCRIDGDDLQRQEFIKGTLGQAAVREVLVEDVLGEKSRIMRLELIPAALEQEIAVLTDITKDKDIQNSLIDAMEQAKAANGAKSDFLSAMSHDLRTPINGIVGMTAIAAAHIKEEERVLDCLTKISQSTEQLLGLINEVLDMSQVESGKIVLSAEPVNPAELLQSVLRVNFPGMRQKNLKLDVHIHMMEHEEVIGDPGRIKRIIENLVSNAIKYTPEGGEIAIDLREGDSSIQGYGRYELTVRDNGIGMSEEFQKKLFQPFEREEDVRISRIQGTGLGMSIVKNFVEMMMGTIEVKSKKGHGSSFKVTVHLRLQEKAEQEALHLAGMPVLVVDNDIFTCESATNILCSIGLRGEWVNDGRKAVDLVAARHRQGDDYMAVLLDWKMPEMSGVEIARRIRTAVAPKVPIIIFTAYEWREIEDEARAAGADAFLSKPIYKTQLLRKMTEISLGQFDAPASKNQGMPDYSGQGKRLLIAEDNDLNREIAVEILGMMGIECDCENDGVSAVRRFAESPVGFYDLILMDIQMPRMNGYEAAMAIRALQRQDSCTVPIVAMTADAFKKDEQMAREAGMNDHLAKPISIERLVQALGEFLK